MAVSAGTEGATAVRGVVDREDRGDVVVIRVRFAFTGQVSSAVRAAGLLFLATVLPSRWFDQLFYTLLVAAHRRQTQAYLAAQ